MINRGARREHIFEVPGARLEFLRLLAELPDRFGVAVLAYAIMGNHYHLLVRSPACGLATVMQWLDQVFTQRMNHRMGWDGPVFKGRYHDVLVADEAHWLHLLAYIHGNPARAGLPLRMANPSWTSHAAYASGGRTLGWVEPDEHLGLLGGAQAYRQWISGVLGGHVEPPDGFAPETWGGPKTEIRPTRATSADPDVLLAQVEFVTGSPIPLGRTYDPAGAVAAWWLRRQGVAGCHAARRLGISPAAVGKRVQRVTALAEADRNVASWMAALSGRDPRRMAS